MIKDSCVVVVGVGDVDVVGVVVVVDYDDVGGGGVIDSTREPRPRGQKERERWAERKVAAKRYQRVDSERKGGERVGGERVSK